MVRSYSMPLWERTRDELSGVVMPTSAQCVEEVVPSICYTGSEAEAIRARALHQGWCLFEIPPDMSTSEISFRLGSPVPSRSAGDTIDRLVSKSIRDAHPASMSRFFGRGAFPFHTDAAYKTPPPHFVLLRYASNSESLRRTYLVRLTWTKDPNWRRQLLDSLICVDSGSSRFYSSVLTVGPGTQYIRYDPVCTKPINRAAKALFAQLPASLLGEESVHYVRWHRNSCLLIDNWMVLHARGEDTTDDEDRVLERALICCREESL